MKNWHRPCLAGNRGGYCAPFRNGPCPRGYYTARPAFCGWPRPMHGPLCRPCWRPPFCPPFVPRSSPYAPPRRFGPGPGAHREWGASTYTYTDCVENNGDGSPCETGAPSATRVQQPNLPPDNRAVVTNAIPEPTTVTSVQKPSPAQTKCDGSKRVLLCVPILDTRDGGSPPKRLKPHDPETETSKRAHCDRRDGEQDEAKVARVKGVRAEMPSGSIVKVPFPSGTRDQRKPETLRVRRSPTNPREPVHSRHSDGKAVTRRLRSVVHVPAREAVSSKKPTIRTSASSKIGNDKVGHDILPAEHHCGLYKTTGADTEPIFSTSDSGFQPRFPSFTAHGIRVRRADSFKNQCTKQAADWQSSLMPAHARSITEGDAARSITEADATLCTTEANHLRGTTILKVTHALQVTSFASSNVDDGLFAETPASEREGRSETGSASDRRVHKATRAGTNISSQRVRTCELGRPTIVSIASFSQDEVAKNGPTDRNSCLITPCQRSAESVGDLSIIPPASFLGLERGGSPVIREWLESNSKSGCSAPDGSQEGNFQSQTASVLVQQYTDFDKPSDCIAQSNSDAETESIASVEYDDCVIVGVENFPCIPTTSQRLGFATVSATSAYPEISQCSKLQGESALPLPATSKPGVPGAGSCSEDIAFEIGAHTALCILDFCRDQDATKRVREIYFRGRNNLRKEDYAAEIRKVVCTAVERKRVVFKAATGVLRKLARLQWTVQAGYGPRIRELQEMEERWRASYQGVP